jgi:hypothetical protein
MTGKLFNDFPRTGKIANKIPFDFSKAMLSSFYMAYFVHVKYVRQFIPENTSSKDT